MGGCGQMTIKSAFMKIEAKEYIFVAWLVTQFAFLFNFAMLILVVCYGDTWSYYPYPVLPIMLIIIAVLVGAGILRGRMDGTI
jgi:hypothetical protein